MHSRCNLACDYCYMYEAADLLQGIYAHIGVTAFWAGRRRAGAGPAADTEFARWRHQVDWALGEVRASPLPTPDGEAFVAAMTQATRAYAEDVLPEAAQRLADDPGGGAPGRVVRAQPLGLQGVAGAVA